MSDAAVSIVVPTLGEGEHVTACLAAIRASVGCAPVPVVVADGSGRGRARAAQVAAFPSAMLLGGNTSADFGHNCNRAAAAVTTPWVLFVNDDVVVEAGFLDPMLETARDASLFAVTPRILRTDPATGIVFDESVHRTFFGFGLFYHERLDGPPPGTGPAVVPISFGSGAALLVRRDRFLALGGFDPLYAPFYWEDFDLAYRAWKRGWRTVCDRRSVVHHRHRATIGRLHTAWETEVIHERNRFLCTWSNVTDAPLRACAAACLPIKLFEARLQRRRHVMAGYRLARQVWGEMGPHRAAERPSATRADRGVLRDFRRFAVAYRAPSS